MTNSMELAVAAYSASTAVLAHTEAGHWRPSAAAARLNGQWSTFDVRDV